MDPALKQRLIGAAVLVALAVIFLPMLLGGPGQSPNRSSEVPLDIPAAPDRPLQTREIPLGLPPPAAAPVVADEIEPTPDPADDPDRIVAVDADVVPRVDAGPEDVAPADVDATVAAPAAAPPASPPAPAPAPARPATPSVTAPPAAAPLGSRFVVNLGSYANRANADSLRNRLRAAGLETYTESIELDGKPATRLRAGPFATRGEAEAARREARRIQADLPASVLTVEAGDAPSPARAAVAAGFAVQVGALRSESEAAALRGRLTAAGFAAYVERTQTDAGTLWRVRAGPELQRDRAERLRDEIRRRLQLDGLVVGHP
jgi:DedD protein